MTTEGPMDSTLVDFWTMIFEKKSHVIVMLSLLEEDGAVSKKSLSCITNNTCTINMSSD